MGITILFLKEQTEGKRSLETCPRDPKSTQSTRIHLNPQPVSQALITGRLSPTALYHLSVLFFFVAVLVPVITGHIYVCICFLCPHCCDYCFPTWRNSTQHLVDPYLVFVAGPLGRAALSASPCCCQKAPLPYLLLSFFPLRGIQPPCHKSQTPVSEAKENNIKMETSLCPFKKGVERKFKFLDIQENYAVCRDRLVPTKERK